MSKIGLLQLTSSFGLGGAEKFLLDLTNNLDKEIFDIHILTITEHNDLYPEYLKTGVKISKINYFKNANKLNKLKQFINNLSDYIKKNDIDIIHSHMYVAMFASALVKKINTNIKVVATPHTINIGPPHIQAAIAATKHLRDQDIIFSNHMKSFWLKKDSKVIPNGIDTQRFFKKDCKRYTPFTFVYVARLDSMKNHHFLIELALKLKRKYNFQMLFVGNGPLYPDLKKKIEEYDLKKHCKLLGERDDIPDILNRSHCFVMPSKWEGMPLSILEAGACELPVIATPVGSIPAIIDVNTGYLSNQNKFEDTMIEVMENYDQAMIKGKNLSKRVQHLFNIKRVTKEHEKLYINLLKK